MSREFDTFIIVPELANGPLKSKMQYLNAERQEPEMVHLCIQGMVASWVHDATEMEMKTIEFFEQSNNQFRASIEQELARIDSKLTINENVELQIIDVLGEQNGEVHLTKLTFKKAEESIIRYCFGLEWVERDE